MAHQSFNRAVQQYPVVIDYCRDRLDVANAVAWSKEHRVPLRVRGGHSFEGDSSGGGALVIDVSEMNGVALEEDTGTLCVQGGAASGRVCDAGLQPSRACGAHGCRLKRIKGKYVPQKTALVPAGPYFLKKPAAPEQAVPQ